MHERANEITALFSANMKALMKEKGMGYKKLAIAADMDIRHLKKLMTGEVLPLPYTVITLAEALKVHPNDFYRWYDDFAKAEAGK